MMMTTSATGSAGRRAFTLVELLLVILIMAVVAAVTVPSLRNAARAVSLRQSVSRVYYLSGLLADMAKQQERIFYLKISASTGEFTPLFKDDKSMLQPVKAGLARPYKVPEDVTITTDPADIQGVYFYPDATSDKAHVCFSDRSGNRLAIKFSGFNSSIAIE